MTMPTWPAGLPKKYKLGTSISFQPNVTRFEPSVGPDIVRRRATVSVRRYQVVIPLSESSGEPQIFADFYENDLKDGTLAFSGLSDPFGGAKDMRIVEEPSLAQVQNGYWELSMTIEEVPV